MADVFVSYKKEERAKVEGLVDALKRLGLEVWYDYELAAGDQFQSIIDQQIRTAKAVVVCWSKVASESEWVQAEADRARAADKFASVSLEPCELPMPYNVMHCADLSTWSGALRHDGFRQLVTKLAQLVSPRLKTRHEELATAEARETESILDAQGDEDERDDEVDLPPAPSADYLLSVISGGTYHAGTSELAATVTQALFEEEILRDQCTRWIVATSDGVTISTPSHATLTRSLTDALERAQDGDCIVILPGTYAGRFEVTKNIRLVGFGTKDTRPVLTGNDPASSFVLHVDADARIENVVIESRQKGHALLVGSSKRPVIVRCLISRYQLVPHDWAAAHAQTDSRPTYIACTISGDACPAMQFAGNARGTVVATDVKGREHNAVLLTGGSKPRFQSCNVIANGGHAVVSTTRASGVFENCTLKSTQSSSTILNEGESFSKFVANRLWGRQGSLIEVTGFARGRFERNKLEPDPEHRVQEEARRQIRKLIFGRAPPLPPIPQPIQVSPQHRARFAENRLPDGSVAKPTITAASATLH